MPTVDPIAGRLQDLLAAIDSLLLPLCLYIVHRLRGGDDPFSREALQASAAPQARPLVGETLTLLERAGMAVECGGLYACRSEDAGDHATCATLIEACAALHAHDPFFVMLAHWWRGIDAFLAGTRSGPEILFPRGDLSTWARLHGRSGLMAHYTTTAVELVLANAPRGAALLELGAGTGAAYRAMCRAAPAHALSRYHFTDVSPAFFDFCDPRQAPFEVICERFDFDRDDELASGAAAMDVVLGVNALHVAFDLDAALRRLRGVMKDGALLVLGEGLGGLHWSPSLLFAMLPGWWHVQTGSDGRSGGFLSKDQWLKALRRARFAVDEGLCAGTYRDNWFGGAFLARKQ